MTHEYSLVADLLRKVNALAEEIGAHKVLAVHVKLGAWVPLSSAALREHFSLVARGTAAEGARLHISRLRLPDDMPQHVLLERIEVEDTDDTERPESENEQ
jgi:Zn finger protein HypA/HybF involved in hydrogenase expression